MWVYLNENENKMDDFLCKVEITPFCTVIYNVKPQGMIIHRSGEWKESKTVCSLYPSFGILCPLCS